MYLCKFKFNKYMKKRIAYLILVFAVIFIFFILQKPFFMLYNDAPGRLVLFSSYLQVMFHGMSLDAATTGYLTAIPWLTILISIWFKKFPLRQLLVGYYAIVCLLISLIFVGDMCLYPFGTSNLTPLSFCIWTLRKTLWQVYLPVLLYYGYLSSCCFLDL